MMSQNRNNEGALFLQKKKYAKAEELFRSAIRDNPDDSLSLFNLSLALAGQKRFDEALSYLGALTELHPEDPDYWLQQGRCALEVGDRGLARECYSRALEIDDQSALFHNNMGVLEFLSGNYDEARACFLTASNLDPDNRDIWFNLRDTYSELGERAKAHEAEKMRKKARKSF